MNTFVVKSAFAVVSRVYVSGRSKLIFFFSAAAAYIAAGTALELAQVKSATPKVNQNKPSPVVFTNVGMGELFDGDEGITLGFTSYKASDGPGVLAMDYKFGSADEARAYFERKISKAIKVVERREKLNRAGKVVGEQVQVQIAFDNKEIGLAVLWTDGEEFREITSLSLKNILGLEKLYRH
jgi:hypothetical protein